MSERSAALGKQTFTVAGYTFNLKITEGVLSEIEERLYKRRVEALVKIKDAYPQEAYVAKLDELLQLYEDGAFDVLKSEAVQKYLQSEDGCVFLLAIMGGMTEKELIPLWIDHREELELVIKQAMGLSFPKGGRPEKRRGKR
jgi:hypothetical protein